MKKVSIMFLVFLLAIPVTFVQAANNTADGTDKTLQPVSTLIVSTTPNVLTAGVVPELVDTATPFTIKVTDSSGTPIDLTQGGSIENKNVWNNLFKDPHPETLDQYYWVRLDLHNDDGTDINNKTLFGIQPIEIDFSMARDGVYIFKGFCANDVGEFKIQVFTPDRKFTGITTVKVRAPLIDYAIFNIEDPEKRVFHTPGDPDFVMTAADNRIYGITATVQTSDGKLIRGNSKGVQTCSSYTASRLTVGTTMLANFYYSKPHIVLERDPLTGKNLEYIVDMGDRYYINLGIDYNNSGSLEETNREIYDIAGFRVRNWNPSTRRFEETNYKTFYNTTCTKWDDGTYATGYLFDYTDQTTGWGMGCIYNSPYAGCYLFPDINEDGKLDYRDSLELDFGGKTMFYIFANDVCGITCLVGANHYGQSDFAGRGPINETDPQDIRKRYRPDGTFMLDMDGWVAFNLASGRQSTSQINATVSVSPEKLEVGKPAHIEVTVTTKNDNKPIDRARVQVMGGGILETQYTNELGKANFDVMPDKPGKLTINIAAGNFGSFSQDIQVKRDETPPELTINNVPLLFNNPKLKITGQTEPGAKVKVAETDATVGQDGRFFAEIFLGEGDNAITIVATDTNGNSTRKTITITLDTVPPEMQIEALDPKIIEAKTIKIKGKVNESSKIIIGDKNQNTSAGFEFELECTYGKNTITVEAWDKAGNKAASQTFEFENFRRTTVVLQVGSNSMLVNGSTKPIPVPPFIERGTTMVPIRVISEALGATVQYDQASKSIEIILGEKQIIMQIGTKIMVVNGVKKSLTVAPLIKNGSTFVPFRAIAEAFDCDVKWASETKEITIVRLWY